ncbi:MAG TPA: glycoside hydrolase family 2 TIM barrel-domain containing protein [Chitinophagaceae bacterium]|nr:glycoside hydrolase family 2 TIM barrel-domain containing protein [Chitinophagaceae bacterium]
MQYFVAMFIFSHTSARNTCLLLLLIIGLLPAHAQAPSTIVEYLSGTDKDHTVLWDFYCTKGMNSGRWTKIALPSNWELQGFGGYSYGHDKIKTDEQGLYKHRFNTRKEWKGKRIFIVFEGAMTDTEVKVNGQLAGPVHQGGFTRFKYDITHLLKPAAANLLEVTVSKMSAQASVNKAERNGDFWTLGGLYRPVYLEITPETYIDRVAIDAKADGLFTMDVYANNVTPALSIEALVQTTGGKNIGHPFYLPVSGAKEKYTLRQQFDHPSLWSPEFPALYQVMVSIKNGSAVLHQYKQKFGFRTVALQPRDGFYLNGAKVIFKGVCRHSEWPESGRTLSKAISLLDIGLMKEMNMNAVRMSHYPPDQHFLDMCDSVGLMVLDELTGWQAAYDTIAGRPLLKELVVRDVNHPSVVIWDNGNEGGWNRALDNDYALYDPQKRLVIHPWEKFNGTDTKHYPDYNYVVNASLYGQEVFFPTEFMHGLYDGGHGAGLDDFWNLMLQHPYAAGGFLWSFHDEGIVRKDKKDSIDTDGNHAPDGIVGPHREKEASFYTIKEIWSPVYIAQASIMPSFNGKLLTENRYMFTNLNQCHFTWKLASLPAPGSNAGVPVIADSGNASITLAPGERGWLSLNLPASWSNKDVLYLTATDPQQKEIFTWSWPLQSPKAIAQQASRSIIDATGGTVNVTEDDSSLLVQADQLQYRFSKHTGYLQHVSNGATRFSLSNGPVLAGVKQTLTALKHYEKDGQLIIEPVYEGESQFMVKWTFAKGQPVKLQYTYARKGAADYLGIGFQYPEEKITGLQWMGRGPYRVWKNRLKGQAFGVWHKKYNRAITGEDWQYPEFAGYHANLYWATVETTEAPFTIYTEDDGMFLQVLQAQRPKGAGNNNTSPAFPETSIGIMNAIPAIGTKFQPAEKMGPQSQQNIQLNYTPISGTLWFDFRPVKKGF